MDKTGPIR